MKIRATILIDTERPDGQPAAWGMPMARDIAQAAQLIQSLQLNFAASVRVIKISEEIAPPAAETERSA